MLSIYIHLHGKDGLIASAKFNCLNAYTIGNRWHFRGVGNSYPKINSALGNVSNKLFMNFDFEANSRTQVDISVVR